MGITTQLVQTLLFCEIFIFSFLLLPIPGKKSVILHLKSSLFIKGLKHILLAFYSMIFLLFLDSCLKKYKGSDNLFYLYHAERNLYLTSFTLFLALIYYNFQKMMIKIMEDELNASVLKKQAHNQSDHVVKIIKDNKEKEIKIQELLKQLKDNEILVKQAKNNQNEYLKLFEKYNQMKMKVCNENKKTV